MSKRGPGQAQGCVAFLAAAENICIGEILMVSEKPQQAAVRAWAAEMLGHGNTADPLVLQSHFFFFFFVKCCHFFHSKSLMQKHLVLCDAVRSCWVCVLLP